MKKKLNYIFALVLSLVFWSCEKDDICAQEDPNTQAVVLKFYDKTAPTKLKNPNDVIAYVDGIDLGVQLVDATLSLPLKADANTTTWNLVLNANDANVANRITDQITFNYQVEQQYVSKACGYKANFILNELDGVVVTHNWISSAEVINPNVVNPNEIHINIYF